jgi:hypothetical protein
LQVIAYLIVSPENEGLLSCGSRFLNVAEKGQNTKGKILITAAWAFSENKVKKILLRYYFIFAAIVRFQLLYIFSLPCGKFIIH